MTREEFMEGQSYRMPKKGVGCTRHDWRLEHCELEEWDGYLCQVCGARFTERCSFDDDNA